MTNSALTIYTPQQLAAHGEVMRLAMGLKPDVPDTVVMAATLLALRYGLDPALGEIQIIPIGKQPIPRLDANGKPVFKRVTDPYPISDWVEVWTPYVGVAGLERNARRISLYQTREERLTEDECKALRRDMWDKEDVGCRLILWRLDEAKQWAGLGVKYEPVVAYGFWRKKANKKKGKDDDDDAPRQGQEVWYSDTIPNTKTAWDVACRRALRAALKKAYDIQIPDAYGEDAIDAARAALENGQVVDGTVVEGMTTPIGFDQVIADLLESGEYTLVQILRMDDEQRLAALKAHNDLMEQKARLAAMTSDELQKAGREAADLLGHGDRAAATRAAMRAPAPNIPIEPPPASGVWTYGKPTQPLHNSTGGVEIKAWITDLLRDDVLAQQIAVEAWKAVGEPAKPTQEYFSAVVTAVQAHMDGEVIPAEYIQSEAPTNS